MKKNLLSLILIISGVSYSQKNILYAEYGGAGYLGTLNYERMLTKNIITRIGYGSYDQKVDINISKNSNIRFYPIGLSYITDYLPQYFSSEWSFTQFYINDIITYSLFMENNQLISIGHNGCYYNLSFDNKTNEGKIETTYKFISDENDPFNDRTTTIK